MGDQPNQPSARLTRFLLSCHNLFINRDHIQCLKWSLASRIVLFIIQVIAINIIPMHDADAFKPQDFLINQTRVNKIVNYTLIGFSRWDSLYFLTIAKHGYVNESMVAFFPLYPLIIRTIKSVTFPWVSSSHDGLLILIGSSVNCFFFIISSLLLYELSYQIFRSRSTALESVKFYCFNPASIFMSACYSESLFQALTLSGLLSIEFGKLTAASIFFSLSCLTRSNGIASLGFIIYYHLTTIFILSQRVLRSSRIIREVVTLITHSAIVIAPFLGFQAYSRHLLCSNSSQAPLSLDPDLKKLCSTYLNFPYSYVQKKYWHVGLFSYYQFKQLPNFLLAQPILAICLWSIMKYFHTHSNHIISLITNFKVRRRGPSLFNNGHCLPFIIHLAFLLFVSTFFMHIQVSTRFILSSTPVIYWALSSAPSNKKYYFKIYFLFYFVLGTILHSTFYPWT